MIVLALMTFFVIASAAEPNEIKYYQESGEVVEARILGGCVGGCYAQM